MNEDLNEAKEKLLESYPGSYINERDEFIVHERTNQYFLLSDCETPLDIECKVLEWLSRPAYKTQPYFADWRNRKFHGTMLNNLNLFLDTNFGPDDMEQIYTYLGNRCNHEKTVRFINSDYDMAVLEARNED